MDVSPSSDCSRPVVRKLYPLSPITNCCQSLFLKLRFHALLRVFRFAGVLLPRTLRFVGDLAMVFFSSTVPLKYTSCSSHETFFLVVLLVTLWGVIVSLALADFALTAVCFLFLRVFALVSAASSWASDF